MSTPTVTAAPPASSEPHVMKTYGRLPFALSHGQGVRVWDTQGREYLDALAGIAVNTLGHGHPKLVPALQDQLAKLIHTCNYYQAPLQEQLAAALCRLSGMSSAFFCSTGLEANEGAIKLARRFGVKVRGVARPEIVVFEKAFHGRSMATLSATGNAKIKRDFGPMVEGFVPVPLNDTQALRAAIDGNPNIVAIYLETIQGEGGITPARWELLREIRQLCDDRNLLFMLDEVQCGMGRTGKWFAHQWAGVAPDVMTLAKGLGSGVPVGAILVGPKARDLFGPGDHGTTFGGNPLSMRAGIETIRIMEEDGLLANAASVGAQLKSELEAGLKGVAGFVDVRGQGLMLGVQLDRPCGELQVLAAEAGLLISVTADSVIRLVPPLIFTAADASQTAAILVPLIKRFLAAPK